MSAQTVMIHGAFDAGWLKWHGARRSRVSCSRVTTREYSCILPHVDARVAAVSISVKISSGIGVERNLRIERCFNSAFFIIGRSLE